ncbi:urea transporter [Acidiplasma cupricumulans]|uniref:urea transporter n=1 Tax=Acidiplasma cupricumulans TaxID=312540 RepID=UPI0007858EE4|nr:urea transporter [Acidiplasma cupricumulans]
MISLGDGIVDFILDGVGQVFFMGTPLVGAIILIALYVNSKKAALFAVIGSIIGGVTAIALGIPLDTVYFGIYGFNSVLTSIALGDTFLEKGYKAYLIAAIGAFLLHL